MRRYTISRTDGSLEAAVDSTGKIVELDRDYNDAVSSALFGQMTRDSSRKLSATVVSQTVQDHRTVVRLKNAATRNEAELVYAPSQPAPLSVTLTADIAPEACVAVTSGDIQLAPIKPVSVLKH